MVIGAMSPAEASLRAQCTALGLDAATCDEQVKNHTMPDGSICDGDIVIDASGRRCIPAAVAHAVAVQRAAALGTKFDPLSPSAAAVGSEPSAPVVFLMLGAAALVAYGLYRVYA